MSAPQQKIGWAEGTKVAAALQVPWGRHDRNAPPG